MATLVSDRYAGSAAAGGGDAALVNGLRAGSRDAFEQLYELYRGQIYNLTLRIVQSPEDACDITQEVFIKAFRKLPDSPVTELHLTPWLYRVAVNASYDHLRTRKVHRDIDDLGADSRAARVDAFEQAEMGRRVEQTLAALSERHRTVLVLKDIHGLRHDEIAEILGTSRNAAETLLFRARDAFRVKYLELTQGQPGSHNVEKWSAAGIGLGAFLHEMPLPAALHGGFPFGAAGAGGAGAAASGAGAAAGAGAASGAGAAAGGAAAGAGSASSSMSLAAGGLLAKVGGVATAKIAAVVIAASVATGGGAAAAYETGALPGLHHGQPPHAAQTHVRAGDSLSKNQGASAERGDSAQAPGAAKSAAAKARAAAKKSAHDKKKDDKTEAADARAAAKADKVAARAAAKADKVAARAAAKAEKAAAKAQKTGGNPNAGGNSSGNSNAGGNSSGHANGGGNSNAGGNSGGGGNSNAGGNSGGGGNSNAGGNSGGGGNGNGGGSKKPDKPGKGG